MVASQLVAQIRCSGGLAPDSDVPMPQEIVQYVKSAWRAVSAAAGLELNWDFWTKCQPRRSTYPACRAVVAAGMQSEEARVAMYEVRGAAH